MNIPYDKYFLTTTETAETLGISTEQLELQRLTWGCDCPICGTHIQAPVVAKRVGPEPVYLGPRVDDIRYRIDSIVKTEGTFLERMRAEHQKAIDVVVKDAELVYA